MEEQKPPDKQESKVLDIIRGLAYGNITIQKQSGKIINVKREESIRI